jgi:hypothetical protein
MHGLRDIEFGHVALNIPPLDFEVLKRRYPDLVSPDAGVRTAKWKWFLRQPESEQYKISKHEGHRVGADRMGAGSRIVVPTTYTRRVD